MISLKEFLTVIDYRITEGDAFGWPCFGPNAHCLGSWNGDHDGWSCSVIFDTLDQTVYCVEACDYRHHRAYRLINPAWKQQYVEYGKKAHSTHFDQAWDDVKFHDLETVDDWMTKARAIVNQQDYDTRIQVPLELSDKELFEYMKIAHERDITLNQLVELALTEAIKTHTASAKQSTTDPGEDQFVQFSSR